MLLAGSVTPVLADVNPPVFVDKWGSGGDGDGEFSTPMGVEVDSDSNVFVVDLFNHRVQVFDPDGDFITEFGSDSPGNDQSAGAL